MSAQSFTIAELFIILCIGLIRKALISDYWTEKINEKI